MTRPQCPPFPGSRALALALLATAAVVCLPATARSASKTTIAAIGDPAPGDPTGVFAGPSFAGWPSAGGDGWIAFRGEIAAGDTSEQIVLAHMSANPPTRALVAAVGGAAPGGGTFKELRRRVVNAHGEVAFLALLNPPEGSTADPTAPTPAGIFLYHNGALSLVARTGDSTPDGALDLVGSVDPSDDPDAPDETDRSPAIDDAGDVAFLSAFAGGTFADGAIFLAPASGGALVEKVHTGAALEGGQLVNLGAPALNNMGRIAFRATVDLGKSSFDGIFAVDGGGLTTLVRGGMLAPMPLDQTITEFGDEVALDDAGDVAFLGGPLVDPSPEAASDDPVLGVIVCHGGVPYLAGYPGETIPGHTVTGFTLGAKGGNQVVSPALAPDGTVVFFASLDDQAAEAILRWTVADGVGLVVYTAGPPAPAPGGGTYFGTESAPAVDAIGGVSFFVRVLNGPASDAVVYQPISGPSLGILVGDSAPSAGFFAGQPFATPVLNDRGDVVFHAFVALGQSSAGIYRSRNGVLTPVVRTGDPAPLPGGPAFQDFSTQPALDATGRIVFAATVAGQGRGIYVADAEGIHPVAVRGDPGPDDVKFTFRGLAPDPDIDDNGRILFAGSTTFKDPTTHVTTRRDGIFFVDGSGLHAVVYAGEPAGDPAGHKLVRFSDPLLVAGGVAYRAKLDGTPSVDGLFFANGPGTTTPIAISQQDLGNNVTLTGFSGRAASADGSTVAFLASRALNTGGKAQNLGQAILRHTTGGIGLVIAKDMPGPAGGTFRSFGEPSMNGPGDVVFRGSFQPASGGTAGLFLATQLGVTPYALVGENTPLGGQFAAFRKNAAINGLDDLAFVASVGIGRARQGLFLATPTVFAARTFAIGLHARRGHDRARLALHMKLGHVTNGADPSNEPLTLTLADTSGLVWSTNLPAGTLRRRGHVFTLPPSRHDQLHRHLRHLRLVARKRGVFDLTVTAVGLDLTQKRSRPLRPPFTISLEIGDDSGSVGVPCQIGRHGGRCSAR